MFCSKRCREEAYKSYHEIECQIIEFYDREYADRREKIALRAFLVGTEKGAKLPELLAMFRPLHDTEKHDVHEKPTLVEDFITAVDSVKMNGKTLATRLKEALSSATEMVGALYDIGFFRSICEQKNSPVSCHWFYAMVSC